MGLETSASLEQVKKAYRALALKNHPDRGGDEEVIKKVNAAYEVLSDPLRRALYDATRPMSAATREARASAAKQRANAAAEAAEAAAEAAAERASSSVPMPPPRPQPRRQAGDRPAPRDTCRAEGRVPRRGTRAAPRDVCRGEGAK